MATDHQGLKWHKASYNTRNQQGAGCQETAGTNKPLSSRANFQSTHKSSSMLSRSVWQPWASSTLYIEPPKALQDAKRSTSTPSQYDRSMSGSQRPWADFNWMRSRNLHRFSGARSHGFPSATGLAASSPNRSTAPWKNKGRTYYNKYTVARLARRRSKP